MRPATMLLAALVLLAGTGCGSDPDDPTAAPTASVATTSAVDETQDTTFPPDSVLAESEPEQPEAIQPTTVESARDYAEWLLADLAYGMRTTFLSGPVTALSTCELCAPFVGLQQQAESREHLLELDDFEVLEVTPRPDLPLPVPSIEDGVTLDLRIRVSEITEVDLDGATAKTYPAQVLVTRFAVQTSRRYLRWDVLEASAG